MVRGDSVRSWCMSLGVDTWKSRLEAKRKEGTAEVCCISLCVSKEDGDTVGWEREGCVRGVVEWC